MKELYLQFVDPDGFDQSVEVIRDVYFIGRHSECDLAIQDSCLSREHIRIDRIEDGFTVTDLGSSNGTKLDGVVVGSDVLLAEEGVLVLGGAVNISYRVTANESADSASVSQPDSPEGEQPEVSSPVAASVPAAMGGGSGFGPALIIAPLLGLFLLLAVGVAAVVFMGGNGDKPNDRSGGRPSIEDTAIDEPSDEPTVELTVSPTSSAVESPGTTPELSPESTVGDTTPTPPGGTGGVDRETEKLVYSFMRNIAKNDRTPYLQTPRFKEVINRTARFKGSAALAANIKSASRDASQIKSIAMAKNLQPEFLAAAAIARLGNSSGNVASTASAMAETLDRLSIVLGNELADDSILVIAAYNEGEAGQSLKMRNRLANLAKKNPTASPREIRTIWFLRDNGEISAGQYDFALNFLAVGTIAQNPTAFGVNAEKLSVR